MQLTYQTDYALRILLYLVRHNDRKVQIKEISEFHKVSTNHIAKIVNKLTALEYVHSTRGRYNSGLQLGKKPEEINVGTVVKQLEPQFNIVECFSDKNTCVLSNNCGLISVFGGAKNAFLDHLMKYTLADF